MKCIDNRKCIVEFCKNTSRNCNLTFHLVPRDNPIKSEKWMKALKLKPNLPQKKFICSDHFETKCFTSTLRRHLLPFAVPTLQYKSPKEEGITWEGSRESHFVWNSMPNSESSKNAQSGSEEYVVASLYLASENESDTEHIISNCAGIDTETVDKKAIEETIDDYLKRRYLDAKNRTAFENKINSYIKKKHSRNISLNVCQVGSVNSQDTTIKMEDSSSSVENQPSYEGTSVVRKQLSCQRVKEHPKQPVNFSSLFKQNNIMSENMTEQLYKEQNFCTSSYLQPVSYEFNQTVTQKNTDSNNISQTSQRLPTTVGNISLLETDTDCDKFAASIAEQLKQMKNPSCRAKTVFNIQNILFKAKSGAYDV